MGTIIICAIIIAICIFAVISYWKKLRSGCCGAEGDAIKKIKPIDKDLSHYPYQCTIGIGGMTCKNCAARIENAFHSRDGYYAQVSLKQKIAVVRMKTRVSDEELRSIVIRAGYSATSIERNQ